MIGRTFLLLRTYLHSFTLLPPFLMYDLITQLRSAELSTAHSALLVYYCPAQLGFLGFWEELNNKVSKVEYLMQDCRSTLWLGSSDSYREELGKVYERMRG